MNKSQPCARAVEEGVENRAVIQEVYVCIGAKRAFCSYAWRTARADVGMVGGGAAFKWAFTWRCLWRSVGDVVKLDIRFSVALTLPLAARISRVSVTAFSGIGIAER